MSEALAQSAGNMATGDHACLRYASEWGRRAAVLRFMRAGLGAREKVAYIADDPENLELVRLLAAGGADIAAALADDRLVLLDAADTYLVRGAFEPEAMMELLRQSTVAALSEGFTGFRVTAEMSWAPAGEIAADTLVDYEDRVDALAREVRITGLCQYDSRRFDSDALQAIESVHPLVLASRDTHGTAVSGLVVEPGPLGELVLRGEVDGRSSASLAKSLSAAAARTDHVRLDLRDVSFIGAAGLRAIRDAAIQLDARGGSLTLISPRTVVTQVVDLMGMEETLTVDEAT